MQIRALSNTGTGSYTGVESAASNGATPFGIPPQPKATAQNNGSNITIGWGNNGNNGAGIDQTQIRTNGNGGGWSGWKDVNASGSDVVGAPYSQTWTIEVRVHNKAGWSAVASASATTDKKPDPKVWVTKGNFGATCNNGPCLKFVVNWQNLDIGTYAVTCHSSANGGETIGTPWAHRINFDGQGSQEINCFKGQDGVDVWIDIQNWGGAVDTEKNFWARP